MVLIVVKTTRTVTIVITMIIVILMITTECGYKALSFFVSLPPFRKRWWEVSFTLNPKP